MMHPMNIAAAAVVATLALLAASAPGQDELTAEAVLAKVERAVGTADARGAIHSLKIAGMISPKGMPMEASFEEIFLGKDRAVMISAHSGMGEWTTGTDGKITWSTDTVLGAEVMKGKEQGGARRMLMLGRRAPWRELYVTARLLGEEKVADRACWKLAMKGDDGVEDVWFVDLETHDLVRADVKIPDFTGGEIATQWRFADFKEVNGVRFPHERKQIAGTYEITYEVSKIEINPEVDPKRLAPPPAVLEKLARSGKDPDKATDAGVVTIHQIKKRAVAVSKKTTTTSAMISRTLGSLLPKVMGQLMAGGKSPAGPPFTRYHSFDGDSVTLDAGMPVREPIEAEGDIVPSWLPGGEVAITWHHGDYATLSATHALLQKWMKEKGWESAGAVWEVYWTDPGLEPDQAKWRTQVVCPVKKTPSGG